jgi:deoxyxylulose-5-phosphate synthase
MDDRAVARPLVRPDALGRDQGRAPSVEKATATGSCSLSSTTAPTAATITAAMQARMKLRMADLSIPDRAFQANIWEQSAVKKS